MKTKNLISILESFSDDDEICITVKDIITGSHIADTYDVDFVLDSFGNLKLQISIEAKH